jgi:hypothetical protein
VPEKPPSAGRVRKGDIVGVTAEEVTAVTPVGLAVGGSKEGLG